MPLNLNEQLGVCSWSLRPANPQELVERVSACGLTSIQLALNQLRNTPEVWGDTGARLADAGISVRSGMFGSVGENYATLESIRETGGLVPDATWEQNQRIAEGTVAIADRLGIDRVSMHAGFIPEDQSSEGFNKIVERIRWVADLFAAEGIALLLETGQETADDLWAFLNAVDRVNVDVNFDPANMILYDKGDPVASLRRLLPRVRQVHIKDATRTQTPGTWGAETPVGDGEVDWPTFLDVLKQANFAGDLVVEREGGDQRIDDIKLAKARLTEWLA